VDGRSPWLDRASPRGLTMTTLEQASVSPSRVSETPHSTEPIGADFGYPFACARWEFFVGTGNGNAKVANLRLFGHIE
jgi:hypothetical protein